MSTTQFPAQTSFLLVHKPTGAAGSPVLLTNLCIVFVSGFYILSVSVQVKTLKHRGKRTTMTTTSAKLSLLSDFLLLHLKAHLFVFLKNWSPFTSQPLL